MKLSRFGFHILGAKKNTSKVEKIVFWLWHVFIFFKNPQVFTQSPTDVIEKSLQVQPELENPV